MDLKIYYGKIREQAGKISDEFPVVVSMETQDGGKAGVLSEVPRAVAARMMVDGRARLASTGQASEFRAAHAAARLALEEKAAAERVQVTLVKGPIEKVAKG